MKVKLLASVAVAALALATPALADDWSGLYAGVGIGVGATVDDAALEIQGQSFLNVDSFGSNGVNAYIGVGYDKLVTNTMLVGVFAEYNYDDQDVTISSPLGFDASTGLENRWAIGGRAGVLLTPTTLLYGTLAYTQADVKNLSGSIGNTNFSFDGETVSGYQVGAGMETKLGKGFSLDARYTYSDFSSATFDLSGNGDVALKVDPSEHVARVGLNYKFGAKDDVAANYPLK